MAEVKEVKETERNEKGLLMESKFSYPGEVITRESMNRMDEVSEEIFDVFRKYDLSIWDAKTIMPFLIAKIAGEANDNEMDIVEYIDFYLKPNTVELSRDLRNFRKFSGSLHHRVESVKR